MAEISNVELNKLVAKKTGYLADDVKNVINALKEVIEEKLMEQPTTIRLGCFSFESKIAEPRQARNPMTGEVFMTDKHMKCNVKVGFALQHRFNDIKFE